MLSKKTIRTQVLDQMHELNSAKRKQYEEALHRQIIDLIDENSFNTIAISYSFDPEIDTHQLMKRLLANHYQVFLPRMYPNKAMKFHQYQDGDLLEEAYKGIQEPLESQKVIKKEHIDLIIVPGVAFSKNGHRVGFGGGFYDRYLEGYNGFTIAQAFPFQLFEQANWPIEEHDVLIDKIITPKEPI